MKTFAYIMLTLVFLLLVSCSFLAKKEESHYTVIACPGMSTPILLNETTGESWQLTHSGWQPIAMLKGVVATSNDIRKEDIQKEIDRRKKIYEILGQNQEAAKIVAAYKSGATNKTEARTSLQAIVPKSLGSLPPGAEDGNWSSLSE